MESGLREFGFEGKRVRVVLIEDKPWWVAKDVAAILDFRDASNATAGLDGDEKGTEKISTLGGTQEMTVINESGL